MQKWPQHVWLGASEKPYAYLVIPIGVPFEGAQLPANVIYATRLPGEDEWEAIMIESVSGLDPMPMTHRSETARALGATHVHVHPSAAGRDEEVADLRQRWLPRESAGDR